MKDKKYYEKLAKKPTLRELNSLSSDELTLIAKLSEKYFSLFRYLKRSEKISLLLLTKESTAFKKIVNSVKKRYEANTKNKVIEPLKKAVEKRKKDKEILDSYFND